LNWLSIVIDLVLQVKSKTLTNKEFKNYWLKTQVLDKRLEASNKTLDYQQEHWTNCKVNSRQFVQKMISSNASLMSSVEPKYHNMRTKWQCFLNKLRDLMVSFNAKTLILVIYKESSVKSKAWTRVLVLCKKKSLNLSLKTLHWMVKSAMHNKTLDFLQIKTTKLFNNSTNIRTVLLVMINKTMYLNRKSTIYSKKTLV
jgi:hypothetical protein